MLKLGFIFILCFNLGACTITVDAHKPHNGIAEVSPNIYILMDTDYRGVFGSESSLIERNLLFINELAVSKGKAAVPIEARIHSIGPLGNWAWFYYKFGLVDINSKEAAKKFEDITLERDDRWAATYSDIFNKQVRGSEFDKLMELYEKKKTGEITEAEYEQKKSKILGLQ